MAARAVAVEDRLDLAAEAEAVHGRIGVRGARRVHAEEVIRARVPLLGAQALHERVFLRAVRERLQRLRGLLHRGRHVARIGRQRAALRLVAADAAEVLARLERGPAAHRLHALSLAVEQVEEHRLPRRDLEEAAAVLLHVHLAEHMLHVPRAGVERDGRLVQARLVLAAVPAPAEARRAVFERHHAELLHRAARNALEPRAEIDVLHVERAVVLLRVREVHALDGLLARHHGYDPSHALPPVVGEQLARPVRVLPVCAEARPVGTVHHTAALGLEGDEVVRLVEREARRPLRAVLPEDVDAEVVPFARLHLLPVAAGRAIRRRARHELDALAGLRAHEAVDERELALVRRMVARDERKQLLRAGDGRRVEDGAREVRVVAVPFGLARAVGVHHDERMEIERGAVVVFPAREHDASVHRHLREVAHQLVGREAAQEGAVRPAAVDVAARAVPAVADAREACGGEHDVAVREPDRLRVRDGEVLSVHALLGERDAHGFARREVHRVEGDAVVRVVVTHREDERLAVPREVGVRDEPVGLVEDHLVRDRAVRVDRAEAELRADLRHRHAVLRVRAAARPSLAVAALGLHLVVPLVVRAHESLLAAEHMVLRVDELRGLRAQLRETRLTAHSACAQVEVAPARVAAHGLGDHERAELGEKLLAHVALRHARERLRHHLALQLAVLRGGEHLRDIEPRVLVDPVALQPLARERHVIGVGSGRVRRQRVERSHLRDLAVVPLAVAGDRVAVHPRPLPHHVREPAVPDRLAVRVVHLHL